MQRPTNSASHPVRVAVVGAGPAGFFTAEALLKSTSPVFAVDVFDRLPTPFGLVRSGVAPDHQKIKAVTKTFERTAQNHRFRFLGNVQVGRDLSAAELRAAYDQVVYAIGSSSDRRLGIPGEELAGSYSATAFVGWYNAHPDFRDFPFHLVSERAVIVGVGNVAMDVARILLKSPDELGKTDIARHAVETLRASRVREVVLLARRGPAHAAFDPRELEDIAALPEVGVSVDAQAVLADAPLSAELDARQRRNLELMRELARAECTAPRRLRLEFFASPVELVGDETRRVSVLRAERNAPGVGPDGRRVLTSTGQTFELATSVVFRSIGYRGEPIAGVPFDQKNGVIFNLDGRVTEGATGPVLPGTYAVGWIRRGPLGVVGTNKADAQLVVSKMVEDAAREAPRQAQGSVDGLLAERNVRVTSYDDWRVLDAVEVDEGRSAGKIREKVASVEQMMNALLRGTLRPE